MDRYMDGKPQCNTAHVTSYPSAGIRKMFQPKANGPRNAKQLVCFSFTPTLLMMSCGPFTSKLNSFIFAGAATHLEDFYSGMNTLSYGTRIKGY